LTPCVHLACGKNSSSFQDFILQQLNKLLEYEKIPKKEAKKRHPADKNGN
jgi:hypothetical protein